MRKIFFLLLLPFSLAAQKNYIPALREFMTGQHNYYRFNGNVLVAKDGNIIYQQALGYADYNSLKQINNQNDRITERINQYFLSMSKLFDAAILLKISKDRKMPEGESAKLLTEDPLVINELLTRAQYLYATFFFMQNLGLARCKTAENLIALINKEYPPKQ